MVRRQSDDVELRIRAGLPYARSARLLGGASVWPVGTPVEVRGQVRATERRDGPLLLDLGPYLTVVPVGLDLVVTLAVPASATRTLVADGFYDVVVSDPGPDDVRGVRLLAGRVKVLEVLTAPGTA